MPDVRNQGKRTVKDFTELEIYETARILAGEIYEFSKKPPFSKDYSLVNQIRLAAVSVVSNIAEGFERNNNKEFIVFLFIAKGSCGEIRGSA